MSSLHRTTCGIGDMNSIFGGRMITRLIVLLILLTPCAALASPVTIALEGKWQFFNPDALLLCQEGTYSCDFFDAMAGYGIPADHVTSRDVDVSLELTFDGRTTIANDYQTFLAQTRVTYTAADLTVHSTWTPFYFTPAGSASTTGGTSVWSMNMWLEGVGPLGPGLQSPSYLQVNFYTPTSFGGASTLSDWANLLRAPGTHADYMMMLGSEILGCCDVFGPLTVTQVRQVPEPSTLMFMVGPMLLLLAAARKRARKSQSS
jgi:hypothetical protein